MPLSILRRAKRMRRRASPKLSPQFRRNKIPPVAMGECRKPPERYAKN
jgi:hypothetical protein